MCKFRYLVCLIVLYGLGFSNQPDEYLFKKQHLVVSLDWHKKISRPNSIASSKYYFFNNGGMPDFTLNDTNHMQGLQTDASKVTFGKIMLESLGSAAGGVIAVGLTRLLLHDVDIWEGATMFVSVPVGLAGGATITGNLLMEPNGSFAKSLGGVAIGSLIGLPIAIIAGLTTLRGTWDHMYTEAAPITYILFITAGLCPITGAVIGYNHNISKKSVVPMMNSPEENEFLDGSQRHCPSIKLQLITMRF